MTAVIPHTDEDFKKYSFALGQSRIWRLHESIRGMEMDCENDEDLHCLLDTVSSCLREAAFMDAGQMSPRKGSGRSGPPNSRPRARQLRPNTEPCPMGRSDDCGNVCRTDLLLFPSLLTSRSIPLRYWRSGG
jgi:hypothetical protein